MRTRGLIFAVATRRALALDADEQARCLTLGFAEGLLCGSCDRLLAHVEDKELAADCRACCAEAADTASATESHARLEVCK